MALEAWTGERTTQTDIWSAGVIFYQMLCGNFPFKGADMYAIARAVERNDPAPLPASIPQSLRNFVARAILKEPQERYATAGIMRKALQEARSQAATMPYPINQPPAPSPQPIQPQPTFVQPQPEQHLSDDSRTHIRPKPVPVQRSHLK